MCAEGCLSLRPSDRGRMSGKNETEVRVNVSYELSLGLYKGLSSPVSLLDIPHRGDETGQNPGILSHPGKTRRIREE